MQRDLHYTIDEKQKAVLITDDGYEAAEDVLQVPPAPYPKNPRPLLMAMAMLREVESAQRCSLSLAWPPLHACFITCMISHDLSTQVNPPCMAGRLIVARAVLA